MHIMTPDPTRVRIATRTDEADLLELCRMYHAETNEGAFSEDKALDIMRRAFTPTSNSPAIIGVAGENRIEGSICIEVATPPLSDAPFLQILWHFVRPESRKSPYSKDLLAFAKSWAAPSPVGIGLTLRIDSLVNHRTEAQSKMYSRSLGEPVAQAWFYNATPVEAV